MLCVHGAAGGDKCTYFKCFQPILSRIFRIKICPETSFKKCSSSVFLQGKAHRDKQLVYLKEHLDKYYYSRDRKWIVLFPEGGFLRKRRETSQLFAKKHSLPHLTHVTLPRLGASHVILKTLSAQQENGSVGGEAGTLNTTGN